MDPSILLAFREHYILWTIALGVSYFVLSRVYSVYFGPLSKFPGPKLAAATLWYEFYYDVVLNGRYTFKIKELHEEYGPIIRISPNELHINDPDYYEELYSQHKPRNKSRYFLNQFDLFGSTFGSESYKLHRMRRAALNPFFSKQQVNRLQPMLTHLVEKLAGRIEEFKKTGEPMPMRFLYACLTTDVVTLYVVNKSWNHLDSPDFSPLWVETIKAVAASGTLIKQFPWLLNVVRSLPKEWVRKLNPGIVLLLEYQEKIQATTRAVISGQYKESQESIDLKLDKTILHTILESDLPPEEKLYSRLWEEAHSVIGAGSDTTANALTITHFHILDNPDVHKKLRAELIAALPDEHAPVELKSVENLPYFNAVIQEGLRFSYGVATRLARPNPIEVMKFRDYEIPAGTPVGMTSVLMHSNPTIFPEPDRFRPERWLEKRPEGASPLDRYMVSFSKGSRQCVGMNLAKAELHLALATVFRRFEHQELFETTRRDVDVQHDLFLPSAALDSKGVRVVFK